MKEEQIKMNEKLLLNVNAEQENENTFKMLKDEIVNGNRNNCEQIQKLNQDIIEISNYFPKFNSTMNLVSRLAIGNYIILYLVCFHLSFN